MSQTLTDNTASVTQNRRRMRPAAMLSAFAGVTVSGALAGSLLFATPAWAHDTLIASTPEAGEVLEESPEEILLEFSGAGLTSSESIPNTIWVTDAEGEHWEGETEVDGSSMSTDVEEELPDGEYEVLYRVVYADGHSEEQSFGFEVAAGNAPDATAQEDADAEPADEDEATSGAESPAEETAAATESPATESPESEEPSDTPSADDAGTTEPAGQSTAWWVGIGIGAVALVALLVLFLVVRRRLRGDDSADL